MTPPAPWRPPPRRGRHARRHRVRGRDYAAARRVLRRIGGVAWRNRIRFAVTGNHDMHTDGGEPLQAYLGSAAARDGHTWFSRTWGRGTSWSSTAPVGSLETSWCRVRSGALAPRGPGSERRPMHARADAPAPLAWQWRARRSGAVRSLWDELYAADAELVLVGHDHDYERFAPRRRTVRRTMRAAWWRIRRRHWRRRSGGVQGGSAELPGPVRRRARGPRAHAWRGFMVVPLHRSRWRGTRHGRRNSPSIPRTPGPSCTAVICPVARAQVSSWTGHNEMATLAL